MKNRKDNWRRTFVALALAAPRLNRPQGRRAGVQTPPQPQRAPLRA